MAHESDEANLMGQVAGIIAVMLAIVQALPPTTRKRLPQHLHAEFASLIAAMCAGPAATEGGREGAEWVRDLFLRQIDKVPGKAKAPRKSTARDEPARPAEDVLDIQL